MQDETFSEAFIHRPGPWFRPGMSAHVVLGKRLRPYSFWHACLLDVLQNPFSYYDAGEAFEFDFAKAFDFPRHFSRGAFFLNYQALHKAVAICRCAYPAWPSFRTSSRRVRRYALPSAYLPELRKFSAYSLDYRTRPIYATAENASPAKTPWYLVSVLALMQSGIAKVDAWNNPIGEGAWLAAAGAEARNQSIDILTPELREAFREMGIPMSSVINAA